MKDNDTKILEEAYSQINENAIIANLINVINTSIEKKQFRTAKESLEALKNMKFGGTPVTEMPEYKQAIEELNAKLGTDITSTKEAAAAEKAAKAAASTPEALLAAAKKCEFSNAKLGYMNDWGSRSAIYNKILEIHSVCRKKDPEGHKMVVKHPYGRYRGVSETSCSCGLSYGVDSSD